MGTLDFLAIRRTLLTKIRGRRSQRHLSTKLGYAFNQVNKWETGGVGLRWTDFADLCRYCNIDLAAAVKHIVFSEPVDFTDASAMIRALVGSGRSSDVADRLAISMYKLRRWLSGATLPDFDDILRVLHVCTDRLLPFLACLTSLDNFPMLRQLRERDAKRRRIFAEMPFATAVFRAIELIQYKSAPRHTEGFIAATLGLSLSVEKAVLKALVDAELLELRHSKYRVLPGDSLIDACGVAGPLAHWLDIAKTVSRAPHNATRPYQKMGYHVVSVGKKGRDALEQHMTAFFNEAGLLADADAGPSTDVLILSCQLFAPGSNA